MALIQEISPDATKATTKLLSVLSTLSPAEKSELNIFPLGFLAPYLKVQHARHKNAVAEEMAVRLIEAVYDAGLAPTINKPDAKSGEYPIVVCVQYDWRKAIRMLLVDTEGGGRAESGRGEGKGGVARSVSLAVHNTKPPFHSPIVAAIKQNNSSLALQLLSFACRHGEAREVFAIGGGEWTAGIGGGGVTSCLEQAFRSLDRVVALAMRDMGAKLSDAAFRRLYANRKARLERHRVHRLLFQLRLVPSYR
jgi:hypothetical protein